MICFDNGTEYRGQKLLTWMQAHSIKIELTVLYMPKQDKVAEQSFWTVFEQVRTTAIDYNILKSLWPELYKGTVYVLNQTATSCVKDITLY